MTSVADDRASKVEPSARRMITTNDLIMFGAVVLFGILGPIFFPNFIFQIAVLWLMVLFAQTWDVMGGQMGYNSLGNIFFFGAGMYICTVTQIGLFTDVGAFTSSSDQGSFQFTPEQYYIGVAVGLVFAAFGSALLAVALGWIVFGLRGPYFAIGTLGIALGAGELIGAWEWVGGGGGIPMPVYPGSGDGKSFFYYCLCFGAAMMTFVFLKWLYSTRFGLAINAIRDDEEKAEAMGIAQDRGLGDLGVFPWDCRRTVRQHDRVYRAFGSCFPGAYFRPLHGRDGASGRQGNDVGTGARRHRVPHREGSNLDLLSWLAVGGAWRHHYPQHRVFPAGHSWLAAGEIPGLVRHRG
jgi:hypothetical protein